MIIKYIYTKFFCIKQINSWFVYVSVHVCVFTVVKDKQQY